MDSIAVHPFDVERQKFAVLTRGMISAPLAGAVYWSFLTAASLFLSGQAWCIVAFFASGTIFPLALLLQKPTGSRMMVKDHPLGGAAGTAFVSVIVSWAVTIPAFHTAPSLVPLALAIGMGLHLPAVGWSLGIRSYVVQPIARAAVAAVLWYALPVLRVTAIPLAVALFYIGLIPFVLREVAAARRALGASAERAAKAALA